MTEADRAHQLLIQCEGTPNQYEAAKTLTSYRPHGSKSCKPEEAQRLARQEQDRRMGRA